MVRVNVEELAQQVREQAAVGLRHLIRDLWDGVGVRVVRVGVCNRSETDRGE